MATALTTELDELDSLNKQTPVTTPAQSTQAGSELDELDNINEDAEISDYIGQVAQDSSPMGSPSFLNRQIVQAGSQRKADLDKREAAGEDVSAERAAFERRFQKTTDSLGALNEARINKYVSDPNFDPGMHFAQFAPVQRGVVEGASSQLYNQLAEAGIDPKEYAATEVQLARDVYKRRAKQFGSRHKTQGEGQMLSKAGEMIGHLGQEGLGFFPMARGAAYAGQDIKDWWYGKDQDRQQAAQDELAAGVFGTGAALSNIGKSVGRFFRSKFGRADNELTDNELEDLLAEEAGEHMTRAGLSPRESLQARMKAAGNAPGNFMEWLRFGKRTGPDGKPIDPSQARAQDIEEGATNALMMRAIGPLAATRPAQLIGGAANRAAGWVGQKVFGGAQKALNSGAAKATGLAGVGAGLATSNPAAAGAILARPLASRIMGGLEKASAGLKESGRELMDSTLRGAPSKARGLFGSTANRAAKEIATSTVASVPFSLSDDTDQMLAELISNSALGWGDAPLKFGHEAITRKLRNIGETNALRTIGEANDYVAADIDAAQGDESLSAPERNQINSLRGWLSRLKREDGTSPQIKVLLPGAFAEKVKTVADATGGDAANAMGFFKDADGNVYLNGGHQGSVGNTATHETGHVANAAIEAVGGIHFDSLNKALDNAFAGDGGQKDLETLLGELGYTPEAIQGMNDAYKRKEAVAEVTRYLLESPDGIGKFNFGPSVSERLTSAAKKFAQGLPWIGDNLSKKKLIDGTNFKDIPELTDSVANMLRKVAESGTAAPTEAEAPISAAERIRQLQGEIDAINSKDAGTVTADEIAELPKKQAELAKFEGLLRRFEAAKATPAPAAAAPKAGATPKPVDPLTEVGLTQEQVDALRDHWIAPEGLEPTAQRSSKKRGIAGKTVDQVAKERGDEFDKYFKDYVEALRAAGHEAPLDPIEIENELIEFVLRGEYQPGFRSSIKSKKSEPAAAPAEPVSSEGAAPVAADATGEGAATAATAANVTPSPSGSTVITPDSVPVETQIANSLNQATALAEASPAFKRARTDESRENIRKEARMKTVLDAATNEAAGDDKLLQKRTDRRGREVFSGTLDPSRASHKALIDELGLSPDQVDTVLALQDAGNGMFYVDYRSAKNAEPTDTTGTQRRKEYSDDPAATREEGTMQTDKAIVGAGLRVLPSGKAILRGVSIDKYLANAKKLLDYANKKGIDAGYTDINDPFLIEDLQGYVANHRNGFKGDGSGPVADATPTEGYDPYLIPRNRFDVLNAAFNADVSTKFDSRKQATREDAMDAQFRALENDWSVDDATGDTNPFRAFVNSQGDFSVSGKTGTKQILEEVWENLSPKHIMRISAEPDGFRDTVRETGFTGNPADVLKTGLPNFQNVKAGFMPRRPALEGFGKARPDDSIYREKGVIIDADTTGLPEGFTLQQEPGSGVFIARDAAGKIVSAFTDRAKTIAEAQKASNPARPQPLEGSAGALANFMPFAGRKASGFGAAEKEGRTFTNPYDNLPRFEIADNELSFKPGAMAKMMRSRQSKLSDVVDHAELFKNYPELADLPISFKEFGPGYGGAQFVGEIDPKTGKFRKGTRIELNESILTPKERNSKELGDEWRKRIIHEVQHGIQEREGHAIGSSPEIEHMKALDEYDDARKAWESDAGNRKTRHEMETIGNRIDELNTEVVNLPWIPTAENPKQASEKAASDKRRNQISAEIARLGKRLSSIGSKLRSSEPQKPGERAPEYFKRYENSAGEIEAREAANRADMTPEQRAKQAPKFEGEDVTLNKPALASFMPFAGRKAKNLPPFGEWFEGIDGKPRFEIADNAMELTTFFTDSADALDRAHADDTKSKTLQNTSRVAAEKTKMKLGTAIKHDELFEQYPFLRDISIRFSGNPKGGGHWDPRAKEIVINSSIVHTNDGLKGEIPSNSQLKKIIVHEVQHIIQDHEGHARGGSPENFNQQKDAEVSRDALSWRKEVQRKLDKMKEEDPHTVWAEAEAETVADYKKLDMESMLPSKLARAIAEDTESNPNENLEEMVQAYGLNDRVTPFTPQEAYRNLAGEMESREAERRIDLTPGQRKWARPFADQNTKGALVQFMPGKKGAAKVETAPEIERVFRKFVPDADKIDPAFFQQKAADSVQVARQNEIAKAYEAAKSDNLSDAKVKRAYDSLAEKIKGQWDALEAEGITIEPWADKDGGEWKNRDGQPYKNSDELIADMRDNKHLYFFTTGKDTFGSRGEDGFAGNNPMMEDSGKTTKNGYPLLNNDILRAVHDAIAHGAFGVQFGPAGEEAAWKAHMATVNDPWARWALTTETRGQNSWVNFRDAMLGEDGMPLKKGDKGYVAPVDRPFADQKADLLPAKWMLTGEPTIDKAVTSHPDFANEIGFNLGDEGTAKLAKVADPKANPDDFGATFDLDGSITKDTTGDVVTLASKNVKLSELTPEAVSAFASKYRSEDLPLKVGVFRLEGQPDTASIDINVVAPKEHRANTLDFAKNNGQESIWSLDDQEVVPAGGAGANREMSPSELARAARALASGSSFKSKSEAAMNQNRGERGQFKPGKKAPVLQSFDLPFAKKDTADAQRQRSVAKRVQELQQRHPEAAEISYKKKDGKFVLDEAGYPIPETIEYNLDETPLAKEAAKGMRGEKRREAYTTALGAKLKGLFDSIKDRKDIMEGKEWYRIAREKIRKVFKDDSTVFAQLLGATSARTPVEENYKQALDAYNRLKSGEYDGVSERYLKLIPQMEAGELKFRKTWGNNKQGSDVTPRNFRDYLDSEDILPRRSNGKKFNANSMAVLNVLAGVWEQKTKGPKTPNFARNLTGASNEATIDVWAARTLHRLSNEGMADRWRILPEAETGVNDNDFAIGQESFRKAAESLGMNPDDLQGVLWFAEKDNWEKNSWTRGRGSEMSDFNYFLDRTEGPTGKKEIRTDEQDLFGGALSGLTMKPKK